MNISLSGNMADSTVSLRGYVGITPCQRLQRWHGVMPTSYSFSLPGYRVSNIASPVTPQVYWLGIIQCECMPVSYVCIRVLGRPPGLYRSWWCAGDEAGWSRDDVVSWFTHGSVEWWWHIQGFSSVSVASIHTHTLTTAGTDNPCWSHCHITHSV